MKSEEGTMGCPKGCSGQAGPPGSSEGAGVGGCWPCHFFIRCNEDHCGSLALLSGPSGHQCIADEFGRHPSVSSRQRVIREPKTHL